MGEEKGNIHTNKRKRKGEKVLLSDWMVKIKAVEQRTHSFLGTRTDLGNCSFKSSFGNAPFPFMISQGLDAVMPESRRVLLAPSGQILGAHCSPWLGFLRQKTLTLHPGGEGLGPEHFRMSRASV